MALGIRMGVTYESGVTPQSFLIGGTYQFGSNGSQTISWTCAEILTNYVVLQSQGVTGGTWPGYKMTGPSSGSGNWGSANTYYSGNIDGADIHGYDTKMSTLWSAISAAEYTSASYGSGLYLVSTTETGTESYSSITDAHKYYRDPLKTAATNYSTWGAGSNGAWLGTVGGSNFAYSVDSGVSVSNYHDQVISCVVGPAFTLDPSKVMINGPVITLA